MATSITNTSVNTDNLTIDTNVLHVDSTNNRVGIGTASPSRQAMLSRSIADGSGELGIVSSDSSTSGALGNIHFGNSVDSSLASIRATADGATDAGKLEFRTEKTGAAIETAMSIDSNGRVTKPNQPFFSARGQDANWRAVPAGIGWGTIAGTGYSNTTGNYQIGTNFTTSGHYGAENIGNHFTNASGHFTAPIAGHYYFYIRMYLNRTNTNSPGIYLNPRINSLLTDGGGAGIQGSYHFERTTMSNSNNAYIPFGRHDVYYMAANDTFTYSLNAEAVGFQIYNQYTEFKGYLIG